MIDGKPKVALFIETSRAYGRGLCLGIADYARSHGEWNIRATPNPENPHHSDPKSFRTENPR